MLETSLSAFIYMLILLVRFAIHRHKCSLCCFCGRQNEV